MDGAATGGVRLILRLEGAAVLATAVLLYASHGAGWGLFALLFFAPDLALLGYLRGVEVGAALYNASHTYVAPALLAGLGAVIEVPALTALALVWAAHIGFDRLLGYGLKLPTNFRDTHLGPAGPATRRWSRAGE